MNLAFAEAREGLGGCDLCGLPFRVEEEIQQVSDDKGSMTMHLKCVIRTVRAAIDVGCSTRPWKPMSESPKNATDVEVITSDGYPIIAHYAEDMSGEDQPPFKGWFTQVITERGTYFREVTPTKWRPLPTPEPFGNRPVVRSYTKDELPHGTEKGYDDPPVDEGANNQLPPGLVLGDQVILVWVPERPSISGMRHLHLKHATVVGPAGLPSHVQVRCEGSEGSWPCRLVVLAAAAEMIASGKGTGA